MKVASVNSAIILHRFFTSECLSAITLCQFLEDAKGHRVKVASVNSAIILHRFFTSECLSAIIVSLSLLHRDCYDHKVSGVGI